MTIRSEYMMVGPEEALEFLRGAPLDYVRSRINENMRNGYPSDKYVANFYDDPEEGAYVLYVEPRES